MKKSLILIAVFLLSACSQFEPFEDMRREAGSVNPVGQSSNKQPVICYNPLWHNQEETLPLAQAACARTNKKAVYVEKHYFSCRLFNPATAIYKCE